jgi:hypothetical protein
MTKIIESKAKIGNKDVAYVEVRFEHNYFVVYADGSAYRNGEPIWAVYTWGENPLICLENACVGTMQTCTTYKVQRTIYAVRVVDAIVKTL